MHVYLEIQYVYLQIKHLITWEKFRLQFLKKTEHRYGLSWLISGQTKMPF